MPHSVNLISEAYFYSRSIVQQNVYSHFTLKHCEITKKYVKKGKIETDLVVKRK